MELHFVRMPGILVVSVKGRLDAVHHGEMHRKVIGEINSGGEKTVVMDLAALEFVGSAGFREFFLIGQDLRKSDGKFIICSLQPSVRRLFDLAQFQQAYPVLGSLEEALSAVAC